jgi:hypothetical protein
MKISDNPFIYFRVMFMPLMRFRDVVDILASYSLIHLKRILSPNGEYSGITDPDRKEIYVSDDDILKNRRKSVIHELLHIYHVENSLPDSEAATEKETEILYRKLFGGDLNEGGKADSEAKKR